jgi:hypothetical protein
MALIANAAALQIQVRKVPTARYSANWIKRKQSAFPTAFPIEAGRPENINATM